MLFTVVVYIVWKNPTIGVTVVLLLLLAVALAAVSFLTRGSTVPAAGGTPEHADPDEAGSDPEDATV